MARKSLYAKVKHSKVGEWQILQGDLREWRLRGAAVRQHLPSVRLDVFFYWCKVVSLQKQSIKTFDEVSLLTSVEQEELPRYVWAPHRLYLDTFLKNKNNKISYMDTLVELIHRLHASLLTGCISCHISFLCACVCCCKMRSTSWLEFKWFKVAPDQRPGVVFVPMAGWSWEFTSSSLSSLVQLQLPLRSSSSAACRGAPLRTSGKARSCTLFLIFFSPGWSGQRWDGCRAVAVCVVALSQPLVVMGLRASRFRGAAPAGRREPLGGPGDVRLGQDGRQSQAGASAD